MAAYAVVCRQQYTHPTTIRAIQTQRHVSGHCFAEVFMFHNRPCVGVAMGVIWLDFVVQLPEHGEKRALELIAWRFSDREIAR